MNTRLTIGETLSSLRGVAQLSQGQAASAMGVPQSQLSRWETGSVPPSSASLAKMAALYDLPALTRLRDGSWWEWVGDTQDEFCTGKILASSAADALQILARISPLMTVYKLQTAAA